MPMDFKSRADGTTRRQLNEERQQAQTRPDTDNSIKIVIGEIAEFDPEGTGRLFATVWVRNNSGVGRRKWGDGKSVAILDSPLDIIQRFGQIRPGMRVEVHWRGIAETGAAWAHIISEESETKGEVNTTPFRQVDTNSSLPFEPGGGI